MHFYLLSLPLERQYITMELEVMMVNGTAMSYEMIHHRKKQRHSEKTTVMIMRSNRFRFLMASTTLMKRNEKARPSHERC